MKKEFAVDGQCDYSNPSPWFLEITDASVRLLPRALPPRSLVVFLATVAVAGEAWAIVASARLELLIVINSVVVFGVAFLSAYYYHNGRQPPWLIYDIPHGSVMLPRHGVTLEVGPMLELVKVAGFNPLPISEGDDISELILVIRNDGGMQSYLLVGGPGSHGVEELGRQLAAALHVPFREC